jgi:hypothetical protein
MTCALLGLAAITVFYAKAVATLKQRRLVATEFPGMRQSQPAVPQEMRLLRFGIAFSVVVYLLAGAADSTNDGLAILGGMLMGLCGALAIGTAGFGFVALWNLWKELFSQLRQAKVGHLLASLPLALLGLAGGLGVLILAGVLTERFPAVPTQLSRALFWILITAMFFFLWKGRSHAAMFLRFILLVLFSAIILVSVVLGLWWAGSLTAYLLVLFLSAIGLINTLFYAVFVRDLAFADNQVYEIDGARFSTLEEFFAEFCRVATPQWDPAFTNLDGFNDVLRGGFGTPEEGFTIRWKNHEISSQRLGYPETVRQLELRLARCHRANRTRVSQDLEQARAKEGPTVFEWLTEIIRAHGPGGSEAKDGVHLLLD